MHSYAHAHIHTQTHTHSDKLVNLCRPQWQMLIFRFSQWMAFHSSSSHIHGPFGFSCAHSTRILFGQRLPEHCVQTDCFHVVLSFAIAISLARFSQNKGRGVNNTLACTHFFSLYSLLYFQCFSPTAKIE